MIDIEALELDGDEDDVWRNLILTVERYWKQLTLTLVCVLLTMLCTYTHFDLFKAAVEANIVFMILDMSIDLG